VVDLQKLRDDDWRIRYWAIEEIVVGCPVDPHLVSVMESMLTDCHWLVRFAAIQAVSFLGLVGAVEHALLARLEDEEVRVRFAALDCLLENEMYSWQVREGVLRRLEDLEWRVRVEAVVYFSAVEAKDVNVLQAMLKALGDSQPNVRLAAIGFWSSFGAEDEIRDIFEEWLEAKEGFVRAAAVRFFSGVGVIDDKARAAILARLSDEDEEVRVSAFDYFVQVGLDKACVYPMIEVFRHAKATFNRRRQFREQLGRFAASESDVELLLDEEREKCLDEDLPIVLIYLVREQDSLRRQENPLRLSIPGCLPPEA
jgi:hypothetical protein